FFQKKDMRDFSSILRGRSDRRRALTRLLWEEPEAARREPRPPNGISHPFSAPLYEESLGLRRVGPWPIPPSDRLGPHPALIGMPAPHPSNASIHLTRDTRSRDVFPKSGTFKNLD